MTWKRDTLKTGPMKWLGYDAGGRRVAFVATTPDGWLWHAELADGSTDAAGFTETAVAAKRAAARWMRGAKM